MLQATIAAAKRRYRSAVLADSPVAYWRLGEASGTTAADEMGSYNGTCTPNSGGAWTGGTLGAAGALADGNTAATFPGGTSFTTTPHVNIGSAMATVFTGNNPRSFDFWIKPAATMVSGAIIAKSDNQAGAALFAWLIHMLSTGEVVFTLQGPASAFWRVTSPAATLAASTWAHVAVVVGDTNTRASAIYMNGVSQSLTASTGGTPPTTWTAAVTNVWIGKSHKSASAYATAADIDEMAIYSSALSAARVLAHYQAARPPA